jgi:hypothetical protein
MKNILIAAVVLLTGLAGYAQKTTVSASIVAANRNHKSKSIDFNVWCGNQPWRGLVINDGMTAMGFVHLALDENQNFTTGVWGGAGFDGDYREINYYVQYQKNNLSIAFGIYLILPELKPQWYLITTNSQQHIIDLRTSYRFQHSHYALKQTCSFTRARMIVN